MSRSRLQRGLRVQCPHSPSCIRSFSTSDAPFHSASQPPALAHNASALIVQPRTWSTPESAARRDATRRKGVST
eukprot:3940782-Rhodomonas_salina.2